MSVNTNRSKDEAAGGSGGCFNKTQRDDYFAKLENWLLDAYAWNSFVFALPFIAATSQAYHAANQASSLGAAGLASANLGAGLAGASISTDQPRRSTSQNHESSRSQRNERPAAPEARPEANAAPAAEFQEVTGTIYRIPSIWKRFVAEIIDSVLLLVLKVSLIFVTVDVFDVIDIEKYYLDILQTNLRIDYKMALELTSGILILELISRVFVCMFEAFWLQYGRNGRVGGATPGKSVMRLKVVLCKNVSPAGQPDDDLVLVTPATDLGLIPALGRSVLKNLILAFFFPTCFALCFFRFNRTGYDLVCHSIVVEDVFVNANANANNNNNNINNNNNNNNNNNENQVNNNDNDNNNNNNNQRVHQD